MGKIRTTCVHIHAHIHGYIHGHMHGKNQSSFFVRKKVKQNVFQIFFPRFFFKFFFVGLHLPFQFSDCPGGCKIFFSFCFQISECLGGCKEAGSAGVSACVYPSPPSHTPSRSSDTAPRKPSRKEGESCGFRSTSYCLAAAAAY